MMIKTFNEELTRQFPKSSFWAIFCLDFVLCPLFPRNTEGRGRNKTQIHANKQRRSQPVICSLTLQLKFRKVEHLLFSPYGRNIFPLRLPLYPVNFRFQKTFPAKYTAQAHGTVTWANRMRATKTGRLVANCISLCSVSCAWFIGHIFACLGDDNEKCVCQMILQVLLFGGNNVWRPWGKSRRISRPLQPVGISEGHR